MPVLARIAKRFAASKVFKGHRVAMCLHLEAKTAVLSEVFLKAGAEVAITGSNPLTTQDDVAAALSETGVHVYAWRGVTRIQARELASSRSEERRVGKECRCGWWTER